MERSDIRNPGFHVCRSRLACKVNTTNKYCADLTGQSSKSIIYPGLHRLLPQTAHPGLRLLRPFRADECNVSFYAYCSTKNDAEYYMDFEHTTLQGQKNVVSDR